MINNPKLLENEYDFISLLGEGSFGKVYKVKKKTSNKLYAIKVESINSSTALLKNEINIYRHLSSIHQISRLYWYGVNSGLRYGVFDLYETDLSTIIINDYDITDLFMQMLVIIQNIHTCGIIHRDLKPENFMIKQNKLYLIDFGLSKSYKQNNKHIPIKKTNSIIGNKLFCSPFVQALIEPARRDDLISLGYCLIYLLQSSLPWTIHTIDIKPTYSTFDLFIYSKKQTFICVFFNYAFSLSFYDEVNFKKLITLLNLYPIIT